MPKLSVETELDKAISTTAFTIADCAARRDTEMCDSDDCASCETYVRAQNVYSTFSDLDKLAIDNKVQPMYDAQYKYYEANKKIQSSSKRAFIVLAIAAVILLCAAILTAKPLDMYTRYRFVNEPIAMEQYRKAIYDCLLATDLVVDDVNGDGEVNCQDWSIIFTALWVEHYNVCDTCAIVINQHNNMNHMFVAVRHSIFEPWEYIEPQAFKNGDCSQSYFMEDYWGNKYNPIFNKIITGDYNE